MACLYTFGCSHPVTLLGTKTNTVYHRHCHPTYLEMASIVTVTSAFVALAVPPVVEPPVVQHEGAFKIKAKKLVRSITLGFRMPVLGSNNSQQYFQGKLL